MELYQLPWGWNTPVVHSRRQVQGCQKTSGSNTPATYASSRGQVGDRILHCGDAGASGGLREQFVGLNVGDPGRAMRVKLDTIDPPRPSVSDVSRKKDSFCASDGMTDNDYAVVAVFVILSP